MARIIASVGLTSTYYTSHLYAPQVAHRIVAGYYENNDPGFSAYLGRDMSKDSLSWAQGAGSIVSTPSDITTWARALYQGTALLPPQQRRELMSLVSHENRPTADVAHGGRPGGLRFRASQCGSTRISEGFGFTKARRSAFARRISTFRNAISS